ncbi:unnamed protein product [Pieris macdunnoughi]|uniref:Uncharacterized protein n=1 Tax=Pieris macdunnoughi TaxID=345717 RepID=A0A821VH73_9NEOP|nr:unnamed protein product [Pieris macdunnoughi]
MCAAKGGGKYRLTCATPGQCGAASTSNRTASVARRAAWPDAAAPAHTAASAQGYANRISLTIFHEYLVEDVRT